MKQFATIRVFFLGTYYSGVIHIAITIAIIELIFHLIKLKSLDGARIPRGKPR